jgi:polyribonucleotide nucleotidyltransferase
MTTQRYTTTLGSTEVTIEFGSLALRADAAVTVRAGDTVVLATAVVAKSERDGIDYLPLLVEYQERLYAAGKISGSRFIKREGRPSEDAVLTSRLIDRPLRPLFEKSFRKDIQVVVTALSVDGENDPDILSILAASAAVSLAGKAPFKGPLSACRVGLVDGELIANPTRSQMEQSTLDLVIAGTAERVMMVEAGAHEIPEATILEAMKLAHQAMQPSIAIQREFAKEYIAPAAPLSDKPSAKQAIAAFLGTRVDDSFALSEDEREAVHTTLLAEVAAKFEGDFKQSEIKATFEYLVEKSLRQRILTHEQRPDGRGLHEVRPISIEVGLLPRAHGSGLFTRGQTQSLTVATLGSAGDEQTVETMLEEGTKRYMHHYNFPPYSTGEVSPLRGTSRREIGHGALAERALIPVLPNRHDFPYTIRLVSEILSSNGSSSMAATCGSTLALMDAGVPIRKPVAGVAMGLITNEDASQFKVLTDLQGLEDFAGDMDFKIAGTVDGITAIQMDTKIEGLTWAIVEQTLSQALEGRLFIMEKMLQVLPRPRAELSPFAPRVVAIQIDPEKIGELIGPGGKNINRIIAESGGKEVTSIDIEDDGTVLITSTDAELAEYAIREIQAIGRVVEVGEVFEGVVVNIVRDRMDPKKEIGAIVEFLPGKDGMVHISNVSKDRIPLVSSVVSIGQTVKVKVIAVDPEKGRIGLSMKDVE